MKINRIGSSELCVSEICLGSMTWGQQNTETQAHRQIDMALEAGVNFIDTAEIYSFPTRAETQGLSELYIGSWLKKHPDHSNLVIATKVAGRSNYFPYLRPHLHKGETRLDKQSIKEAVEGSLKRLNIDTIDLYQLHWPERNTNFFSNTLFNHSLSDNNPIPVLETLEALSSVIDEGKVRYIGLSNETPWGAYRFKLMAEKHGLPEIVSIQNPYNLAARAYDLALTEISVRENIGLLAYSALAGGSLSGKYLKSTPKNSRQDLFPESFVRFAGDNAKKLIQQYVELAGDLNISPITLAIAWCIQQPQVTSAIIGATSEEQLTEILTGAQHSLSEQEIDRTNEIFRQNPFLLA